MGCAEASPADDALLRTLAGFLQRRLAAGDGVCVGFSGGCDSTVLLHALCALRQGGFPVALSALHVQHGLSEHADDWVASCVQRCRDWQVPLEVVPVAVAPAGGEGIEAAARRARYAAFAASRSKWLALAHHRDDQAETVLYRLLRGTGVAGAAGMPAERGQGGGPRLLRPLLLLSRATLADYACRHALRWIDDESNADTRFARNFLRRVVVPTVEQRFPEAAASLARAARHFAEARALLEDLAQIDRQTVAAASGRIALRPFNALPPARARNLLRYEWSAAGCRSPETRWLEEALRQLASAHGEAHTCVRTADGELHVYRGELYCFAAEQMAPAAEVAWCGESELRWGAAKIIFRVGRGEGISERELAAGAVVLRPRQGGECLQPHPRRPRKALRKLLQQEGVPPWERQRLPLLWCGGRLAWVGGVGVDAAFACPPGEPGIVPVWISGRAPRQPL